MLLFFIGWLDFENVRFPICMSQRNDLGFYVLRRLVIYPSFILSVFILSAQAGVCSLLGCSPRPVTLIVTALPCGICSISSSGLNMLSSTSIVYVCIDRGVSATICEVPSAIAMNTRSWSQWCSSTVTTWLFASFMICSNKSWA